MPIELTPNYKLFNSFQSKEIVIIVKIPGIDLLSNRQFFSVLKYGDPNEFYGGPDNPVYGGNRTVDGVRDILSLDKSSLTISQKLENEQGRASISMLSFSFIDKDQYMTQVLSPGVIIPEILGAPVTVLLGYLGMSYPEDYLIIFRGTVSDVSVQAGMASLQFSDPNIRRRQKVFYTAKSVIGLPLLAAATTVPVGSTTDFYHQILGPDGTYDTANPWNPDGSYNVLAPKKTGVRTFLSIESELIEYGPLGISGSTFINVKRGALGTVAVDHAAGTEVSEMLQFQDHAMDMALKLMLSTNGAWIQNQPIFSFVKTFDPILMDQTNAIILPPGIDAIGDYGLVTGDYVTITGSGVPGNNTTGTIVKFSDLAEQSNRIIYLTSSITQEYPSSAKLAFRSQYDTYPLEASVRLTPVDVDVQAHIDLKNTFLSNNADSYRFQITAQETLKNFLESEVYLPVAAYSLTKRGRLSVGYTKPPLSGQTLVFLNQDNVIDPQTIMPRRGINTRKFFNEIDWSWDFDLTGNYASILRIVDADSINQIGVVSILPITSRGARSDLGTNTLFDKRSQFLLSRYRRSAVILNLKINWEAGSQIEAGDIVAVQDEGALQISNFNTGVRNLGTQLFEVIDRSLDIKSGNSTLSLVSGINSDVTDRYGVISPSSSITSGTSSYVIIQDSFGSLFPGNEAAKWTNYVGQLIAIHDTAFTYYQTATLTSIDPINTYKLYISTLSPLPGSFSGLTLDVPNYPDTTKKLDSSIYKSIHAFLSAQVAVSSGSSPTQFDVGSGDISKFFIGARIIVYNDNYVLLSPEVAVTNIVGTTISVSATLGFTPNNTFFVGGIGFSDTGGFYRWI